MSIPHARPSWYTFETRTDLRSADAGSVSSPSSRRARPDHTPPDADFPAVEPYDPGTDRGDRDAPGRRPARTRVQARPDVPAGSPGHGFARPRPLSGLGPRVEAVRGAARALDPQHARPHLVH